MFYTNVNTCQVWYRFGFPFSSCHIAMIVKAVVPQWNVSSLWSNCYLAFLEHSFFSGLNTFYSLSSCMNYAVYVKRLKVCFHCILSEWDLLYLGFFLKAKSECCCWPWHQITRQTLYSDVWILAKCDAKTNRVLAWDPSGQQSYGAFLYSKSHSPIFLV